ncbi:MAG: hypothetical protein HUU55_08235 [Myxococcales bacterium]|nr:hypothetical protein [Myxococcales bacterium]
MGMFRKHPLISLYTYIFYVGVLLVVLANLRCDTGLHAEDPRIGQNDFGTDSHTADMSPSYMICETTNYASFSTVSMPTVIETTPQKPTVIPFKLLGWVDSNLTTEEIDSIVVDVQLFRHGAGSVWDPCSHRFPVRPQNNSIPVELLEPGVYTLAVRLIPSDDLLCKTSCSEQVEHTFRVVPPIVPPTIAVNPVYQGTTCASKAANYVATIQYPTGWADLKEIATIRSTWEIYDNQQQQLSQVPSFRHLFYGECSGNPSDSFPCTLSENNYLTGLLSTSINASANFLDPGDIIVLRSHITLGAPGSDTILEQSTETTIKIPVDCNQQPVLPAKRPVTLGLKKMNIDFPGCPAHAMWQCTVSPDATDPDSITEMVSTSKKTITDAYTDIQYRYVFRKKGTTNPQVTMESDKPCAWVTIGFHPDTPFSLQNPNGSANPIFACATTGNLATDFLPGESLECIVQAYNPSLPDPIRTAKTTTAAGSTVIPHPYTYIIPPGQEPDAPQNPQLGVKLNPTQCNDDPSTPKTVLSEVCCTSDAVRCGQPSQEKLRYSWSWHRPAPDAVSVSNMFIDYVSLKLNDPVVGFPLAQKGDDICCEVYSLEQKPAVAYTTCTTLQNAPPMPQKDSVTTIVAVKEIKSTEPAPVLHRGTSALCSTNLAPIDPDVKDSAQYQTCWMSCDINDQPPAEKPSYCNPQHGATDTQWFSPNQLPVKKGDSIACRQFPVDPDGAVGDSPKPSTCLVIENAPPTISLTKTWTADPIPSRSAEFSCSAVPADLDNDPLETEYEWRLLDATLPDPNDSLLATAQPAAKSTDPLAIPIDLQWSNNVEPTPGNRLVCCARAVETNTPQQAASDWLCDPVGIVLDNKDATCTLDSFSLVSEDKTLTSEGGLNWSIEGANDPDHDMVLAYVHCDYFTCKGDQLAETFGPFTLVDGTGSGKILLSAFSELPCVGTQVNCIADVIDVFADPLSENPPKKGGCGKEILGPVNNAPPSFPVGCDVVIKLKGGDKDGQDAAEVTPGDTVTCEANCVPTDPETDTTQLQLLTVWDWSDDETLLPTTCGGFSTASSADYVISGCHADATLTCSLKVKDDVSCGVQTLTSKKVSYKPQTLPNPVVQITHDGSDTGPVTGDTLTCVGTLDMATQFDYAWSDLDSDNKGTTSELFLDPTKQCWAGVDLLCKSTATGSCDNAQSFNTATVHIHNHVPTWHATMQPSDIQLVVVGSTDPNPTPTILDKVQCTFDTQLIGDPDFPTCVDQTPIYTTTLEWVPPGLNPTVSEMIWPGEPIDWFWTSSEYTLSDLDSAQKAASVRCCVEVSDGTLTSEKRCSNPKVIVNAPPYAPQKVSVKDDPWTNTLLCETQLKNPADPDFDPVTAHHTFTVGETAISTGTVDNSVIPVPVVCNTQATCSATIADLSDGALSNNVPSAPIELKGGGSLLFSSAAQQLTAPITLPNPAGTLSMWWYIDSYPPQNGHILVVWENQNDLASPVLSLALNPNGTLKWGTQTQSMTTTKPIPTKTWVPVALTWAPNEVSEQTTFRMWLGTGIGDGGSESVELQQQKWTTLMSTWPTSITWYGSDTFHWAIDEIHLLHSELETSAEDPFTAWVPQFAQPGNNTAALWHITHQAAWSANAQSYPDFSLLVSGGSGPQFTRASVVDECDLLTDLGPTPPAAVNPTVVSSVPSPDTDNPSKLVTIQCEVPEIIAMDVNGDPITYTTFVTSGEATSDMVEGPVGKFDLLVGLDNPCVQFQCAAFAQSTMPGNNAITTPVIYSNPAVIVYDDPELNCGKETDCNTASCGEQGQCNVVPIAAGNPCTDFDPCTHGDSCNDTGQCVGGLPCGVSTKPCIETICITDSGACQDIPINGELCDDGDPCTTNDQCSDGQCKGTPMVCPSTECTTSGCENGVCNSKPNNNWSSCDDGDPCTETDLCLNGTCSGISICCTPPQSPPTMSCGQHQQFDASMVQNKVDYYGTAGCNAMVGTPEVIFKINTPIQNTSTPWLVLGTTEAIVPKTPKPTMLLLGDGVNPSCTTTTCSNSTQEWLAEFSPITPTSWFTVEGGAQTTPLDQYNIGYLCPTNGPVSGQCAPWKEKQINPFTSAGSSWVCAAAIPSNINLKTCTKDDTAPTNKFRLYGTYEYTTGTALNTTLWATQTGQSWEMQPRIVVTPKAALTKDCASPAAPTACTPSTMMDSGPWVKNTAYCIDIYVFSTTQPVLLGKTTPTPTQ